MFLMCREIERQSLIHTAECFKKVFVFKVLECLCIIVLAGVLLLSSLMGKNEIKITVTYPESFVHAATCTASCLEKTVTYSPATY